MRNVLVEGAARGNSDPVFVICHCKSIDRLDSVSMTTPRINHKPNQLEMASAGLAKTESSDVYAPFKAFCINPIRMTIEFCALSEQLNEKISVERKSFSIDIAFDAWNLVAKAFQSSQQS